MLETADGSRLEGSAGYKTGWVCLKLYYSFAGLVWVVMRGDD